MGNNASSSARPPHHGPSSNPSKDAADAKDHARQKPKRRESIPALPNSARAAAAPPSASLESAQGQSSSASRITGTSHTRARSKTSVTADSKPHEPTATLERSVSAQQGLPSVSKAEQSSPTQPMQVPSHPIPTDPAIQNAHIPENTATDATSPSYFAPSSQYGRPPRLPLPIEEEVLAPGSPITSPMDLSGPIGRDSTDPDLPRASSVVSSTTADDEEALDEFEAVGRATGQMVDTLVEWKEGGEKVYITGSFSGWTKKHRLHRNGPSKEPNTFSAIIPLVVGAHHMTFLVDNQMRTSAYLPTAVDYTNVLINYVEVSPDDALKAVNDAENRPVVPIETPHETTAHPEQQLSLDGADPPNSLPPPTPDLRPTEETGVLSIGPSGIATPIAEQVEKRPEQVPSREVSRSPDGREPHRPPRRYFDETEYHSEIPAFLADIDAPEHTHRYARASAVMATQPTPPSLPMFLNKSVLNVPLHMKDDASVLQLPNHTVLNHLATTSIRQNVLAASATTRYKRKVSPVPCRLTHLFQNNLTCS